MQVRPIALVLLLSVITAFTQGTQNVYVLNTLGQTLSKVELATGVVQKNAVTAGLYTNQVVIRKQKAYIVNSGTNSIQIVDLSSLTTIDSIYVGSGSNPYYMDFLNDSIAVVSLLLTNELVVVNVDKGSIVTRVILYGTGPEGVKVAGGKVYVAMSGYNGQGYDPGIINVVNPASWSVTDTIGVSINPQYIDADDSGYVYVASTGNYVDVGGALTIIDTQTDEVVQEVLLETFITTLDYHNGRVFLATYGNGVYIYDVAGDSLLNTILSGGPGVLVDTDGYIYVTDFNADSLYIYDASLQRAAAFEVGDGPISVAVDDPILTDIQEGESPAIPEKFQLYQNFPNPFNPSTTIRFELSKAGRVKMEVLNILGQSIVTLLDEELPAGVHTLQWHGQAADGRRVPSGIYFYRLTVNGQQKIRKMHFVQ